MNKKWFENPVYRGAFMVYIFITIIFPLGFYTLLVGPSKWVLEASLKNSWSEHKEKLIQQAVILILILVSIKLTDYYKRFFVSESPAFLRYLSLFALTLLLLISVYIFSFKPEIFIRLSAGNEGTIKQSTLGNSGQSIEFVLGAYPDLNELRKLKASGYTGVVSLLNELVVPAEPNLIREEEENTHKAGIPLIRIPLLPWVSVSNESILMIRKLAKDGKGKYYVHCYLGRDRVNVFRKIVMDMDPVDQSFQTKAVRHIDDLTSFERGNYTKIGTGVYLIPYPTDDEFLGYILNGQIATVVSLLDPDNPQDTTLIAREKVILKRHGVKYVNLPVPDTRNLPAIKNFTDSFPKISKPLVIHKFKPEDPVYDVIRKKVEMKIK